MGPVVGVEQREEGWLWDDFGGRQAPSSFPTQGGTKDDRFQNPLLAWPVGPQF